MNPNESQLVPMNPNESQLIPINPNQSQLINPNHLCSNSSGQRDGTFDCHDIEQDGANLVVSEYVVEADRRFSGYAECNVNASERGVYDCECRDRSGGAGRRQLQSHHRHHPSVPCNATVGRILVLNESGLASHAPGPNSFMQSPYAFWYYNLAQKLVTG
eukprot:SAG31_NODE_1548_length_7914_cov_5.353423_11_plen_160_part_00